MRSPDGQVVCTADGYPIISPVKGNLIGDREPDFLLGLSSNISWKNFTLSFLLDSRKGGDVVNVTQKNTVIEKLWSMGLSNSRMVLT